VELVLGFGKVEREVGLVFGIEGREPAVQLGLEFGTEEQEPAGELGLVFGTEERMWVPPVELGLGFGFGRVELVPQPAMELESVFGPAE
jgi:hypothetical protein